MSNKSAVTEHKDPKKAKKERLERALRANLQRRKQGPAAKKPRADA